MHLPGTFVQWEGEKPMAYLCFLCNEDHLDSPTEEHFIPRSIDGPERQWLPVCEASNTRSNSVFDSDARDILYEVRFQDTGALKRSGEALLADGTLKSFKFSYHEASEPEESTAFHYIFDRETRAQIPCENVFAIASPVGLRPDEQETYCRGLAKMSIGALAYLLREQGVEDPRIKQLFSQNSINAIRHFALDVPWPGSAVRMRFSLGRSDVLVRLQGSCSNPQIRNHVIEVVFEEDRSIHVEGMLYSQYGWALDLSTQISMEERELRLENQVARMDVPGNLRDLSQSPDRICIINPVFRGEEPTIPPHWRNS